MNDATDLILASKSTHRARLLSSAGIAFETQAVDIDERLIEKSIGEDGLEPADIASILAQTKAVHVSELNRHATVIGCDQTLEFENDLLHKPANIEEARRRLLQLSGKTHQLHSAIALAQNGEVIWQHVESATIGFRRLDPAFVGRHVARVGEKILTSVGAYQIEGEGIQLFEKIEGDFFSIIGLPLLALLKTLRKLDIIDG